MNTIHTIRARNLNKTKNESEYDEMQDAFASFACELEKLQKFRNTTIQSDSSATVLSDYKDKAKVLEELLKCKTKIKSKKNHIRILRGNLKTACFVAKVVASARKPDTESQKMLSGSEQRHLWSNLLDKYSDNLEIVTGLSKENEILRNKFDTVATFIRLGYEELQKIRNDSSKETSVFAQLKQLIKCCGEYYANYCNKRADCVRLEQKNNFLTNKIRILENNVEDLLEQLKSSNHRNFRFDIGKLGKDQAKNGFKSLFHNDSKVAFSETQVKLNDMASTRDSRQEVNLCKRQSNGSHYKTNTDQAIIDLSPHLTLIKKLLGDQETLLGDLKLISQEFNKE